MIAIDRQLRRYFILVTVISVLVIFLLANAGMNFFFTRYVRESNLRSDNKVVSYIEDLYQANNGTFNSSFHVLVPLARGEGIEIRLKDLSGNVLLDTSAMGGMPWGNMSGRGMSGNGMGHGYRKGMESRSWEKEDLLYREYPVYFDSKKVALVEIGRGKSVISSAQDRSFFLTMNVLYIGALFLALVIAVFISSYVSKKFLRPLLAVKRNIESIAENKHNRLETVESSTTEIHELYRATRELSRTLQEQENLRKRLTSDIAHELRTPLATLQSYLEAMIDGVWQPTPERLSHCYDEIIRLTGLINNLSELSSIESEEILLNMTSVDLSKLMKNIVDTFQPMFKGKDIELTGIIQEDVRIRGDAARLNQIFVNLLSNAYKYTREKGKVTVTVKAAQGKAVVEVSDTGIGIAAADLPYIFERFYRGDPSRSRESGGSGIGLTITKALVEAHNGTISVESEPDKGTTFRVVFDLHNIFKSSS